jgi:hypothetical protein
VTYKGQTRPLVREGASQRQDNKFQTHTLEKEVTSGQKSTKWACHQDMLTDCKPQVDSDSDFSIASAEDITSDNSSIVACRTVEAIA